MSVWFYRTERARRIDLPIGGRFRPPHLGFPYVGLTLFLGETVKLELEVMSHP